MEIKEGFLEISQASNPNGRRNVKMVLHEIYPTTSQWNRNGITYLEQYTRDNAESVKGMPLCAEFLDGDKDVPYGHGLTGSIGNMPTFEDSVQVGVFDDWSIEDIEIDGDTHRCLCATGYINESRYPHFVKWIEDQIAEGVQICGSVEFVGTKDNDGQIIYDGGWKEQGRIPMIYDYSGYCILSVMPSDPTAILLELNQFKNNNGGTEIMNEFIEALNTARDEIINKISDANTVEINEAVENAVAEVNATNDELKAKIAELESKVSELETNNAELESKVSELEAKNTELVEQCSASESKCAEAEENACKNESEKNEAVAELNELKKSIRISELNQKLSSYTKEEVGFAKDEIEAFNADPFSVEINSITEKIEAASYRQMKEKQDKENLETNSSKGEFDGIVSCIDAIVGDDKTVENFDCFA